MARRLRFIPSGALVEVTCRTIQGRFLMRPTGELRDIIVGVLGRAQRLYHIQIQAFIFLSNHYHLLVTADSALQLAQFMCFVNSNIAREAGKLSRWREKFWSRRYEAIVVSGEESAQLNRLRYLLSNGCKEGLVESPRQWPGAQVVTALLDGVRRLEGRWFDRTKEYESSRKGQPSSSSAPEFVTLSPLPCWKNLDPGEIRRRVKRLVREIEIETASQHQREGTSPQGIDSVLGRDPHDRPDEFRRTPAPRFHAATRTARRQLQAAYAQFVELYREGVRRFEAGEYPVSFPEGSFPPRLPFASPSRAPA